MRVADVFRRSAWPGSSRRLNAARSAAEGSRQPRFASCSWTWTIGPISASSAHEQPVGALGRAQATRPHQLLAAVDPVDRVVLRLARVEEPQHALEAAPGIRGARELALRSPRGAARRLGCEG